MRTIAIALFLLAIPFIAVAQQKPASIPATEAVRQADIAWAKIAASRDIDAFMAMVADDAHFVSGGQLVTGKDAIHNEWGGLFRDLTTTVTWEPEYARGSGDLGYTIGTYVFRGAKAGESWERRGRYLTEWQRGKDGKWRAIADIGSPEPPPKK